MSEAKHVMGSPDTPESPGRRRLFVTLAAGASALLTVSVGAALGALALSPLRRRVREGEGRVDLGPESAFEATKAGQAGPQEVIFSRTVEDGYMERRIKERAVVVPDPNGPAGLAVLDTTCSHLGCGVAWNAKRNAFLCPCHGGVYDVTGKVVSGPPPRPLTRLPLVVEGGRLSLDVAKLAAGRGAKETRA